MDAHRFDALVASLSHGRSRRAALGGLIAAVSHFLLNDAAAKKKKKKCKRDTKKCGKKCIPATECCGNADCDGGGGKICQNGACVCPAGTNDCDGTCVDLFTDASNCGGCGLVCGSGQCIHGACTCANVVTDCFGGCTCGAREEGQPAVCFDGPFGSSCTVDTDCPLGSACLANNRCSGACLP